MNYEEIKGVCSYYWYEE